MIINDTSKSKALLSLTNWGLRLMIKKNTNNNFKSKADKKKNGQVDENTTLPPKLS